MGWSNDREQFTREGLDKLKDKLLKYKYVSDMEFEGLKEDRRAVLPAGIAILYAVFDVLGIDHLVYSDGALREGVMYDLLGRFKHEDIRDRSVHALMGRYNADAKQAERVVQTAQKLFNGVASELGLSVEDSDLLLRRAAYLHEIGLAISHAVAIIVMVRIYYNIQILPVSRKLIKIICHIWWRTIVVNCALMPRLM